MTIKDALLAAQHALTTTDGLLVSDSVENTKDIKFQIDNSAELALIDKAFQSDPFDPVTDIRLFHEKFGLAYDGKPRLLPQSLQDYRVEFMLEEVHEYENAGDAANQSEADFITPLLADQLDALVDAVYVILGTAYLHGFDFRTAWNRVHAANMQKARAQNKDESKRLWTFDVVKPEGWVAPDHTDLVEDHAHQGDEEDAPGESEEDYPDHSAMITEPFEADAVDDRLVGSTRERGRAREIPGVKSNSTMLPKEDES